MNATIVAQDQFPHFRQLLARHEAELADMLRHSDAVVDQSGEVTDFKALAQEAAIAAVHNAQVAHAVAGLHAVQAARQRLDSGCYGACIECGEPIDPRRLQSLPATPWCAECAQAHERGDGAARWASQIRGTNSAAAADLGPVDR